MQTADELFAQGLVAALKLEPEPGKKYILVFDAASAPQSAIEKVNNFLRNKWGIEILALLVRGKPADAIRGIESEDVSGGEIG